MQLTIKLEDAEIAAEEVESLREQVEDRAEELRALQLEIDNLSALLDARDTTVQAHEGELEYLRQALIDTEDAAETLGDGFLRRARDAEREVVALRQQVDDLSAECRAKDEAVLRAVGEAEMEKASALDVRSRLNAFTSEIDRLSLSNAELRQEVENAKRGSSSLEIKLLDMAKKIDSLGDDKELLNVALDSKQTELVLLQRQLGQGTPKSRPLSSTSLAASTSRLARPSMGGMGDVTPVPKSLSKSVSHTSLRTHSRASSVSATPTPTPSALPQATARARAVVTPTPLPLGSSSRHNRTPERKAPVKKTVAVMQRSAGDMSRSADEAVSPL
jgi:predicted RNase H-like nuclease (RuvC/YqgF family)